MILWANNFCIYSVIVGSVLMEVCNIHCSQQLWSPRVSISKYFFWHLAFSPFLYPLAYFYASTRRFLCHALAFSIKIMEFCSFHACIHWYVNVLLLFSSDSSTLLRLYSCTLMNQLRSCLWQEYTYSHVWLEICKYNL